TAGRRARRATDGRPRTAGRLSPPPRRGRLADPRSRGAPRSRPRAARRRARPARRRDPPSTRTGCRRPRSSCQPPLRGAAPTTRRSRPGRRFVPPPRAIAPPSVRRADAVFPSAQHIVTLLRYAVPQPRKGTQMTTRTFAGLAADTRGVNDERAPLVFLHGLTFDRSVWRPALRELDVLDPGRRSVAFDLPGHGRSADLPSYRLPAI